MSQPFTATVTLVALLLYFVEQMALFLPALWLYAAYVSDRGAAVGGVIYALAYTRDPASRGPGAMITLFASVGLWLGAAYGVVWALI